MSIKEKIINKFFDPEIKVDTSSKFLRMLFGVTSWEKTVNPVYGTYKGGLGGWNDDMTFYDYFCLWGHLRFCYNKKETKEGWTWISLHGYKNGYTYSPVRKLLWNFNWHFAYGKHFPWIKVGFDNVNEVLKFE